MRYARKIPKLDVELRDRLLKDGYKKLKEAPNLLIAFLLSIPFMILNGMIVYGVLHLVDSSVTQLIHDTLNANVWEFTIRFDYVIVVYLFILAHEIIHLVSIPGFYRSDKTFWGIKPWGGFVFTTEPLSKTRFLIISVAPFVILSLIVPVILAFFGLLNLFLLLLIFLNALSSSVDMLNFFTVLFQVPNKSTLVNNGFESYYIKQ